jgi:hypothetical protein
MKQFLDRKNSRPKPREKPTHFSSVRAFLELKIPHFAAQVTRITAHLPLFFACKLDKMPPPF